MIQASIAAFLGVYISVFHAPRMDLFWSLLLLPLVWLILKHKNYFRMVFIALFFFIWTQSAVQLQLESRYKVPQKSTVTLLLEITQLPMNKAKSVSFIAKPLSIVKSDSEFDFLTLNKIKVNWYQATSQLKGGQIWRMTIRMQPPHGYQNDGGFDYERWMFVEGISATAYVVNRDLPVLIGESSNAVLKIRAWLSEKIIHHAQGLTYLSLFQTLSMGDKTLLPPVLKQLFVNTGTAHLLVISGLHVGLFSLMFYFLASRLWLVMSHRLNIALNQRDFAVIWAWSAALVYAALAGFSLPTLRALIMLSVLYVALLRRHKISFLNVFSVAVILVLLWQPLALLSFSFWLSFLAVLLIVFSQYGLKNLSKFQSILVLQLLFSILFIPLNAIVFNQLIISSFFANLVLIPVMSFIVIPINLLAAFLASIDWFAVSFLYQFLDSLLSVLITYLNFLQDVFGEPIALSYKNMGLMLVSAAGAMALFSFWRLKLRLPALFIIVMPWFYWQSSIEKGALLAHFFDVGMGTSVLIQTQNHTLLFDVGPGNKSTYQPAKWVILPYLQRHGIDWIDEVILSHSDQDHYGGIWPLADKGILPKTVLSGSQIKIKALLPQGYNVQDCHQTKPWRWDGVEFKFLALKSKEVVSDNNHSCVLKVTSKYGSVLLLSDVEVQRENELVMQYKNNLAADVMLVPHHGSKTSSSLALLDAVQPIYAVVTAGFLNHWGFPKHDVMKRYDKQSIRWFDTAVDGSVVFNIDAKGINVIEFRRQNIKFWY